MSSVLQTLSSTAPYHLLSYASLIGATLWHSFVSSLIARKTLPRPQLGQLQSKLFPIYFSLQTALSGICLLTTRNRNAQIIFVIGIVGGLINLIVFGPWTIKLMNKRFTMERDEGKQYNEPDISSQFKALNKQFGMVHGCSMMINMIIAISLVVYPFIVSLVIV
ncbi:unnamed protein product [Adineta steineri]|uniref:TMEM205-like domain-containing protein n=1 Tax=Adineta steineri TaxID=433720 RepID=A0A814FGD0_9BILA|nr:unnamed protein product [Adineta steineri]CAF1123475.1 unnamed protein product [Adineta steineri]